MKQIRSALLLAAIAATLTGYGQTYNVFAAASLRESVTKIAREFEAKNPGVKIGLSFAGSQQLAAQIKQGAQADVFLSAGLEPVESLNETTSSLRLFALNRLSLIVPANDHAAHAFKDLDRFARLVVADKSVPVGHYTGLMLDKAEKRLGSGWRGRVVGHIVSKEQDVRAVLAKVELGEADAGIVYATDVLTARSKVRVIPIPSEFNVEAKYPVVEIGARGHGFVKFLFSDEAQRIFAQAGFASPLTPPSPVSVIVSGKSVEFDAGKLSHLPLVPFSAEENGVIRRYKGFDLHNVLRPGMGPSILLIGADLYHVDANLAESLKKGCYLVMMKDGNLEAVFPGQSPKYWVTWLRTISVR